MMPALTNASANVAMLENLIKPPSGCGTAKPSRWSEGRHRFRVQQRWKDWGVEEVAPEDCMYYWIVQLDSLEACNGLPILRRGSHMIRTLKKRSCISLATVAMVLTLT